MALQLQNRVDFVLCMLIRDGCSSPLPCGTQQLKQKINQNPPRSSQGVEWGWRQGGGACVFLRTFFGSCGPTILPYLSLRNSPDLLLTELLFLRVAPKTYYVPWFFTWIKVWTMEDLTQCYFLRAPPSWRVSQSYNYFDENYLLSVRFWSVEPWRK